MNSTSIQHTNRIIHPPAGFEQELLITVASEHVNERNKPVSTVYERRVKIKYLGEINQLHKYQLACVQSNTTRIKTIEYAADVLAKINTVFSILVVSTNDTGEIVKLHNFSYVQEKWTRVRRQLLQDYTEELFMKHVSDMDLLIHSYEAVIEHIQSVEMYGLYFNGYHRFFKGNVPVNHVAVYGKGCNNISVNEIITGSFKESAVRQLAELYITADRDGYSGTCRYIDGVPEYCRKELKSGTKTLTYSAVWIGLKKLFQ